MSANYTTSKIALGLSGGVDSAVCTHLLKQQGYDVTAVYLECWKMPGCRAEQDRQDALKIALQLDIPFKVLDFKDEYQKQVMSYFIQEYKQGRTPNPDVLCNRVIKFGMFYDWAMKEGFDYVATGHYAQITDLPKYGLTLATSRDQHKDQTYFLHQLQQNQLNHILFPIGAMTKKEVRGLAHDLNLPVADKKDSVGICFVGEINVRNFLREKLGQNPGKVVTPTGNIIGQHQGLWFYTIGQRKGYNISTQAVLDATNWADQEGNLPPLYVVDKNQKKNQLVVGPEIETKKKKWAIDKLHWINPKLNWQEFNLEVRIRHTGQMVDCQLEKRGQGDWLVTTKQPLKGIAAGQFSVLYTRADRIIQEKRSGQKNNKTKKSTQTLVCLGGGVIT